MRSSAVISGTHLPEQDISDHRVILVKAADAVLHPPAAGNRRAILAIEKGIPGERAFAEAFAAWKQ